MAEETHPGLEPLMEEEPKAKRIKEEDDDGDDIITLEEPSAPTLLAQEEEGEGEGEEGEEEEEEASALTLRSTRALQSATAINNGSVAATGGGVAENFFANRRRRAKTLMASDVERLERMDDQQLTEAACQACRVEPNALSAAELKALQATLGSSAEKYIILKIRNACLRVWYVDCHKELTVKKVLRALGRKFCKKFPDPGAVVDLVLRTLTRMGLVNFGSFRQLQFSQAISAGTRQPLRVIVIGAGMAGLGAARHLQQQGALVTVLEAKDRVGGRIHSLRWHDRTADMGAMVLTGLAGNPLVFLIKQLCMRLHPLQAFCPLWHTSGELVGDYQDRLMEILYNRVLAQTKNVETESDSLGNVFRALLDANEMTVLEARHALLEPLQATAKLMKSKVEGLTLVYKKATTLQATLPEGSDEPPVCPHCIHAKNAYHVCTPYCQLEFEKPWENPGFRNPDGSLRLAHGASAVPEVDQPTNIYPPKYRIVLPEATMAQVNTHAKIREALLEAASLEVEIKKGQAQVKALREALICKGGKALDEEMKSALSNEEQSVLDFHVANLEYGNAATLDKVSLKNWDQDDEYGFEGPHMLCSEGFDTMPRGLAADLDVRLSCPVAKIETMEREGMRIHLESPSAVPMEADAVVVALPLGVLKSKLDSEQSMFHPSLSAAKEDAVRGLGFGLINKVVLCFEDAFWRSSSRKPCDMFGACQPRQVTVPGTSYIYWDLFPAMGKPTLLAISAGKGAENQEVIDDETAIRNAKEPLWHIFRSKAEPLYATVTRWRSDERIQGSYSFIAQGCTGEAYDVLGQPEAPDALSRPRLYFAGEHTNRRYPATVHGAYLSGLRAAAEVLDAFLPLSEQLSEEHPGSSDGSSMSDDAADIEPGP